MGSEPFLFIEKFYIPFFLHKHYCHICERWLSRERYDHWMYYFLFVRYIYATNQNALQWPLQRLFRLHLCFFFHVMSKILLQILSIEDRKVYIKFDRYYYPNMRVVSFFQKLLQVVFIRWFLLSQLYEAKIL